MLGVFRALLVRVKALLVLTAVQELEADTAADTADRQAGLLDLAARYNRDGKPDEAAGPGPAAPAPEARPPAGVLPTVGELDSGNRSMGTTTLPTGAEKPAERPR